MRIERLRLDAFGRLSGLDTGPRALPGLVVALGPNESGKSTLFHFLTSMLYGFYPATREGNPYAPWNGEEPGGALSLRLDGGACVEVERRLLSQPSGRLLSGGRTEDLRNRTLPWAEHVPRTVFRQVYALTLADLAGLDGETWARVQDRIVGAMGAADLRPARHVATELEQEAGELWRPTRRGHQRVRAVQDAIRELRERRRGAAERDRRLREIVLEAEAARERLAEAREARQRARIAVERVQALAPVRAQLRRIEALLEDAGPAHERSDLPPDPSGELRKLREREQELRRRLDALAAQRAEPEAAVAAFGPAERRLIEHADEISRFLARSAGLGSERARLAALEQEARDLARRIEACALPLLARVGDAIPTDGVTSLAVPELRERVRRLSAARDERRLLEAAAGAEPTSPPSAEGPGRWIAPLALLLAGAVLVAVGIRADHPAALALGAAAGALGAAGLAIALRGGGRRSVRDTSLPERLAAARAAEESARAAVAELTRGLPLHASVAEDPGESLVSGLERLQELLRDRADRAREAGASSDRLAVADTEARGLADRLRLEGRHDASALAHLLEREGRRAERLDEAATGAERELARLEGERARVSEELRATRGALEALTGRLEREGGGDASRGAREVQERMRAAERAEQLRQELERTHPDLEEIRSRIAEAEASGEGWTLDDEDLARRKAGVERLTEEVEALAARAEALDRDAAHLREAETADAVDGEIAALEEEERRLMLERDRRWVLARLLRQADRRFREEHQPDLMRRAGVYLCTLTGGRYDRIVAEDAAGSGRFHILGPGAPGAIALAPPVSTGTLEQAYLALRLAIVDHLDEALERLPLFVDEVFVNWDERRRARGMDLLARVAERRQVFAFTCHADVARALEARGALVLSVEG